MQEPPERLVNKYRLSWLQATDLQREALCSRLGLIYTSANDESLFRDVAEKQQSLYISIRRKSQEEKRLRKQASIS